VPTSPNIFSKGGTGGGGNGAVTNVPAPVYQVAVAGTANTGGGGGGGYVGSPTADSNGKSGGSGVVIIRYAGAQQGTGGTVTSAGGYTYHTFTSSGTYTA
jgi:hypothetical protein